ncbi:hypothetical protein WG66_001585 [Moniliophthora roreri]|nr:hypothetical protein WG66_001585 [Moniliophthora roreri]
MSTPLRVPLVVFQHDLKGHTTRTEHWCLVALFSRERATVFELIGNSDTLRGGVKVGSVPENRVEWLKKVLGTVGIHKYDVRRFDCQFWVLAALNMLGSTKLRGVKGNEIVLDGLNEAAIRFELFEERERWERGDDTFQEREYSS